MKKYAADNLLFLRKHYPEIYKIVRNQFYNQERYRIVQSRNEQANLVITDESGTESYLYSRYNPEREAEKWLETVYDDISDADNILLYGLGFGYHLEAMLHRYPEKKLFVYEPNLDILYAAIECCDLRPLLGNKQIKVFAVGEDFIVQSQMLELTLGMINGSLIPLILPAYEKIQPSSVKAFRENLNKSATLVRANLHTATKFQADWAENTILNTAHNLESYFFGPMKGAAENIPAVVVGSGPSLGMEIETLRKLKNHVCIIAAGSSIQALLQHGIEPDLLVSMDPSDKNHDIFKNINIREIPFLYTQTIRYKILEQDLPYLMHGYFSNDQISKYLMNFGDDDVTFLSTATVTGTAIQAAIYMNCSEIVFIGQDFSYPNDQIYTTGVDHFKPEELKGQLQGSDRYVENVNGQQNRTSLNMQVLKESVETVIQSFNYSEYYNASKVGAAIKHTKLKTLEQLYEERKSIRLNDEWFKERMRERLRKYPDSKVTEVHDRIRKTASDIPILSTKVEEILLHVAESSSLLEKPHMLDGWFTSFDKQWNSLTEHKVFKNIFTFLLQREINYIMRQWPEVKEESNAINRLNKLKGCIEPLLHGMQRTIPVVERSFLRLMERLNIKEG